MSLGLMEVAKQLVYKLQGEASQNSVIDTYRYRHWLMMHCIFELPPDNTIMRLHF